MRFVIIDDFNESINLVTNWEGTVKVFNSLEDAQTEADDCQNGIIIDLNKHGTSKDAIYNLLDRFLSSIMHLIPDEEIPQAENTLANLKKTII